MRTAPRLDGLAALITGAANGIGRATAELFHREGARTMLVDIDEDAVVALASRLGSPASAYVADLGEPGCIAEIVAHAEAVLGAVDILVNNAGLSSKTPFLEVHEREWDRLFAVNVEAAEGLARLLGARMAERRSGCILNVSSISGRGGGPPQSVYGITKGALLGLTRQMAAALAPYSVRVDAVLPGVIDTPMVRRDIALGGDPDGSRLAAWIVEAVPIGRIGLPEEVAAVLAFLASADGAAISGALIPIEGGFLSA